MPFNVAMLDRPGWLFDLDGTLIDSSAAVVGCFHAVQQQFGQPPAPATAIVDRIGYPFRETVAAIFSERNVIVAASG